MYTHNLSTRSVPNLAVQLGRCPT